MPSHPSLEGLREAVAKALDPLGEGASPWNPQGIAIVVVKAQADYLRTHGVGWFGDGLVRAAQPWDKNRRKERPVGHVCLVPVPSEAGEEQ